MSARRNSATRKSRNVILLLVLKERYAIALGANPIKLSLHSLLEKGLSDYDFSLFLVSRSDFIDLSKEKSKVQNDA